LDVHFTGEGDSDYFAHTFDEINLDCDDDGILFPQVGKSKVNKRHCYKYAKRGPCTGGNGVRISGKGKRYSRTCLRRRRR